MAVQCKRRKRPVGPWAIREISGAVASGRHARRRPILMTNDPVTPRGREAAQEAGVRLIAREELADAIWLLKIKVHPEAFPGDIEGAGHPDSASRKILPATAVTLGIASCASVTAFVVVLHAVVAAPRPTGTAPRAASSAMPAAHVTHPPLQPGPTQVVREYYAAISRHDWPSVWRLGGRNLGQGPSATYDGMVSGYQGTIRDDLTALHVTGDTATGTFVAYQTGQDTRTYQFTFRVHDGVIVSGEAK